VTLVFVGFGDFPQLLGYAAGVGAPMVLLQNKYGLRPSWYSSDIVELPL